MIWQLPNSPTYSHMVIPFACHVQQVPSLVLKNTKPFSARYSSTSCSLSAYNVLLLILQMVGSFSPFRSQLRDYLLRGSYSTRDRYNFLFISLLAFAYLPSELPLCYVWHLVGSEETFVELINWLQS